MKKLLFINITKNHRIIKLHTAEAEHYGHEVYHLLDAKNEKTAGLRNLEFAEPNIINFYEAARKIIIDKKIDYITTQCEILYPLIDNLSKYAQSLPKMDIEIDTLVDKGKFANFCATHGIEHPDTFIPKTIEEVESSFDRAIFVKPSNGTNGTHKLFLSEDLYAPYDYMRFKSPKEFVEMLRRNGWVDEFEKTQTAGANMPAGKSLYGILGNHIIQECVGAPLSFVINVIIADGKTHFLMLSKTENRFNPNIYMYTDVRTDLLVCNKFYDNSEAIKSFIGRNVYESFLQQMDQIRVAAGIELASVNVHFIPYKKNSFYVQDIQFRPGGTMTRVVKLNSKENEDKNYRRILFDDLRYHSIWEYI